MDPTSTCELLNDARAKTEKLITGLLAQRRDLEKFVDRFAQGHTALDHAIDASQSVLEGIDQALAAGSKR